jgi:hypothetical protein
MPSLPIEVVLIILSFGTQIRLRNGKLMDQLQITDEHSRLLSRIPQIIPTIAKIRHGRLVNFVCGVRLTPYLRIEKVWYLDADMYWWTLKRSWPESWETRPVTLAIHDLL